MSEMVPEGWREQSIKELIGRDGLMTDGDWIESKDQDPNGEIKLIQLADIGDGFFIDKSSRFMTIQKSIDLKTTKLQKNDILVARMPEPIGRSCLFPRLKIESVTVVDIAIIRTTKSNPYWLMSLINNKNVRNEIALKASGSTRTRIARKELEQIKVKIPPLPEQEKIASILTSVDEVIEKTESQISKLQDLKKGMMQELLTQGIGHTEFKDSPVGRIPKGWTAEVMTNLAKVTDGTHKTPKYTNEGVPFLRVTDLKNENIDFESIKYVSQEEHLELIKRCKPEKDDILYSKNGTIGIPRLIDWDWEFSIFVSLALIKITKKELVNPQYLEFFMESGVITKQVKERAKQGTVTNLHLEEIRVFVVLLPSRHEQQKIASILSSIDSKIEVKRQKLQQTQNLKKSLMQDLLTGKVRVSVN